LWVLRVWALAEFLYITRAAACRRSVRNNLSTLSPLSLSLSSVCILVLCLCPCPLSLSLPPSLSSVLVLSSPTLPTACPLRPTARPPRPSAYPTPSQRSPTMPDRSTAAPVRFTAAPVRLPTALRRYLEPCPATHYSVGIGQFLYIMRAVARRKSVHNNLSPLSPCPCPLSLSPCPCPPSLFSIFVTP